MGLSLQSRGDSVPAKRLLLHAERAGLVKMTPVYSIWKILPILLSLSVEISSLSGIDNLFNYGIFAGLCRGYHWANLLHREIDPGVLANLNGLIFYTFLQVAEPKQFYFHLLVLGVCLAVVVSLLK